LVYLFVTAGDPPPVARDIPYHPGSLY